MKNNQENSKNRDLCINCPRRNKASQILAKLCIFGANNDCPGPNTVDYIRTTEISLMEVDAELYGPKRLQEMKHFYESVGFDYEANNRGRTITNTLEERLTRCHKEAIPTIVDDEKIGQIFENPDGQQWIRIQRGTSSWPLSFSLDAPSKDQIYPPIEE